MQERHRDNDLYFKEQSLTTQKYVIPYIQAVKDFGKESWVLEVGCGEGGNLMPFYELGCTCFGIDIDGHKIEVGREKLPYEKVRLIHQDIYDIDPDDFPKFDIIFLRDVIEHIHNQELFMRTIRNFLKEDGVIFFAFPPWRMPFGGHQQVAKNKWLSRLPFYHILPKSLYRGLLKMGGETDAKIQTLLEIKETGISIRRFHRIVRQNGYEIVRRTDWFINPNYEVKFNLNPRKLIVLNKVPYIRDFFTTCYYCIVRKKR